MGSSAERSSAARHPAAALPAAVGRPAGAVRLVASRSAVRPRSIRYVPAGGGRLVGGLPAGSRPADRWSAGGAAGAEAAAADIAARACAAGDRGWGWCRPSRWQPSDQGRGRSRAARSRDGRAAAVAAAAPVGTPACAHRHANPAAPEGRHRAGQPNSRGSLHHPASLDRSEPPFTCVDHAVTADSPGYTR
jgi:hypothetical protein